jgi:hypothetical protein
MSETPRFGRFAHRNNPIPTSDEGNDAIRAAGSSQQPGQMHAGSHSPDASCCEVMVKVGTPGKA